MESLETQNLSRNILKLRKNLQWTQRDLADAIGANQAMVARWESGNTAPRSSTLERIAQVFQVTIEELQQADLDIKRALQLTQDPELNRLLTQVPEFDDKDREALKIFLEAISFRHRMRSAFQKA